MAQQVKAFAVKPDDLSLTPWNLNDRRKEPAPTSYPLTSTWTL